MTKQLHEQVECGHHFDTEEEAQAFIIQKAVERKLDGHKDLSALFYTQTSNTPPRVICSVIGMPGLYYTFDARTMRYTAVDYDPSEKRVRDVRISRVFNSAQECREYLIALAVERKLDGS